ncbi:hypothetical protein HDU93_001759, partial [Gonapodya sp. JEL0774]
TKELVVRSDTRPQTYPAFIKLLQSRVMGLGAVSAADLAVTYLDTDDGAVIDVVDDSDLQAMWETADRGIAGYAVTVEIKVGAIEQLGFS